MSSIVNNMKDIAAELNKLERKPGPAKSVLGRWIWNEEMKGWELERKDEESDPA